MAGRQRYQAVPAGGKPDPVAASGVVVQGHRNRPRTLHELRHREDPRQPLLTKLEARDRAQLVVIAYETGLIRRGSN